MPKHILLDVIRSFVRLIPVMMQKTVGDGRREEGHLSLPSCLLQAFFVSAVLQDLKHGFAHGWPKVCLRRVIGSGVKHEITARWPDLCFKS